MFALSLIFPTLYLFALAFGIPVEDGSNVGVIKNVGNDQIVTGQELFPYVVHISVNQGESTRICTGVIVGSNAVLTAAHCLPKNLENSKIIVHAGIVDVQYQQNAGQKREVSANLVHKDYKECPVGQAGCCFAENDIVIFWITKAFNFGSTVKKAQLYNKQEKPYGKKGLILGWGLDSYDGKRTMLQKGNVKIVEQEVCENLNVTVSQTETVICMSSDSKNILRQIKSSLGDDGGPFESDGVVYGLSRVNIVQKDCPKDTPELFTFIGMYYDWINDNIAAGPPKNQG